jgi:hypothetical protein
LIHKERIIGDREINGTGPPYAWQIEVAASRPPENLISL